MQTLRRILQDPSSTKFVVVTIPTVLGVAETKRLVQSLESQNVRVSDIVINQCVNTMDENSEQNGDTYYQHRQQGQQKWIDEITQAAARVSASSEYQANGENGDIVITKVPFWDVELVGAPALDYIGSQIFPDNSGFAHLLETTTSSSSSKLVLCGGKGGVGKTTTSASLAVHLAKAGHKVALISTDPAHSLGDAVQMDLRGGKLQECTVWNAEGSLSVLEIDPAASLSQFKRLVDQLMGENMEIENAGLRSTLQDLQQVFDTLPAGTDEVVALAKIVNLMKDYDRIVIDTAPTGHTLRMLSTPGFLADLIEKLLRISDKINANPLLQMYLGRREDIREGIEQAKSTLLKFQFQMYDLEDLFSDPNVTEFLIVLVPTELAVRESIRLLNDLTFQSPDMPIKVRNIVVNQVLSEEKDSQIFLDHVANSQKLSMGDLERFVTNCAHRPVVTKVPYLDTEPRGVYGLKIISEKLLNEQQPAVEASQ
jgi:arsenite-transporting ATPase